MGEDTKCNVIAQCFTYTFVNYTLIFYVMLSSHQYCVNFTEKLNALQKTHHIALNLSVGEAITILQIKTKKLEL